MGQGAGRALAGIETRVRSTRSVSKLQVESLRRKYQSPSDFQTLDRLPRNFEKKPKGGL